MKKRGVFMCDTVYLKRERRAFFGKNSDRSPNEAHLMLRVPGKGICRGGDAACNLYQCASSEAYICLCAAQAALDLGRRGWAGMSWPE